MRCTKHRSTCTPIRGSHRAINGGSACFSSRRYHSSQLPAAPPHSSLDAAAGHGCRTIFFNHREHAPLAKDVMALTVEILARGLTFLFPKLQLLLLNPRQLGNSEDADRVLTHARRR